MSRPILATDTGAWLGFESNKLVRAPPARLTGIKAAVSAAVAKCRYAGVAQPVATNEGQQDAQ